MLSSAWPKEGSSGPVLRLLEVRGRKYEAGQDGEELVNMAKWRPACPLSRRACAAKVSLTL
jgi:hypothetical protein